MINHLKMKQRPQNVLAMTVANAATEHSSSPCVAGEYPLLA